MSDDKPHGKPSAGQQDRDAAEPPEAEGDRQTGAAGKTEAGKREQKSASGAGGPGGKGRAAAAGGSGSGRTRKAIKTFVLLILLVALAGLGYVGYEQWRQARDLAGRVDQLESLSREQAARLEELGGELAESRDSARSDRQEVEQAATRNRQQVQQLEAQLEEELGRLQNQLGGVRERLRAISSTTNEDWKLAEAYYLARLAEQRLALEEDTGGALELLQAADDIVRDFPDPELRPARQALASDIAALRNAGQVDREGLYLQLSALQEEIRNLPAAEAPAYRGGRADANEEDGERDEQSWRDTLRRSFEGALERLRNVVRVTRHDEPPRMLSPEQQHYLRAGLQTDLDTAQLALMRQQPSIYRASLEEAIAGLRQLETEADRRSRLRDQLQELREAEVQGEVPDIQGSQEALARYLDERHQLSPDAAEEEDSPEEEETAP